MPLPVWRRSLWRYGEAPPEQAEERLARSKPRRGSARSKPRGGFLQSKPSDGRGQIQRGRRDPWYRIKLPVAPAEGEHSLGRCFSIAAAVTLFLVVFLAIFLAVFLAIICASTVEQPEARQELERVYQKLHLDHL